MKMIIFGIVFITVVALGAVAIRNLMGPCWPGGEETPIGCWYPGEDL